MSSMPSQSNEVIHAPFIENPELFPEDLELEEDPEQIQQEADVHIVAVRVHNEKRWLEWEDWQWKEEEELKRWVEEKECNWKEEEDQKKEKVDKDAYEEKLAATCKTQLEVSIEVSIPSIPGIDWAIPDFEETEVKVQIAMGGNWWGKEFLLFQDSGTWLGFDL